MLWWGALVFFNQGVTHSCYMEHYSCVVQSDWFSSPTGCSNPPIPEQLWCYLDLWPHHCTCQYHHTDHTVAPLKVLHTVIATLPGLGKKLPELFAFLLASLLTSTEQALFGNPNTLGWEAPPNNAPLIPLFHVNIILSLPHSKFNRHSNVRYVSQIFFRHLVVTENPFPD